MPTLLRLDSSLYSSHGTSSQLTALFTKQWVQARPDTDVIHRDLSLSPPPHLDAEHMEALAKEASRRTLRQQELVAAADILIQEVRQADTLVIGLPLYNFGIPSTLKAWFDHICRAGDTFSYAESGPVGTLGGRRVFALSTRGDRVSKSGKDPQTDHVRAMLNFLGMNDVSFIYAEGLTIDEECRAAGMAAAESRISLHTCTNPVRA